MRKVTGCGVQFIDLDEQDLGSIVEQIEGATAIAS
jgi:hypothetical protein